MKIISPYLFLILLFVCSCDKEDDIPECNVENPMEELEWLADIANSIENCSCQVAIFKGRYNGGNVYFKLMNDPLCNSVFGTVLWNCKGIPIKTYGADDFEKFSSDVDNLEVLYECKDSE